MAAEGAKAPKGMWVTLLPETLHPTAGPSLTGDSSYTASATHTMVAAASAPVGATLTPSARYPPSLKPAPRPLTEAIQSRLLGIVVGGEMEMLDNIVKEQPELADSMYDYAVTLAVQRNSVAMIKHILTVRSSLVARSDYALLRAILEPLSPTEAPPSTTLDLLRAVMAGGGMPRDIVHLIIRRNLHKSVLDAAVESGADVNAKDDNGVRPLFVALGLGRYVAVPWIMYLLDNGARLDVHDSTPLRLNPLMKVLDRIKRTTDLKGWEGVMAAMVDKRPQVLTDTDALHANTLAHACRCSCTGVMSMEYLIKAAETEQESKELPISLQELQIALFMGHKSVGDDKMHHSRLTGLLDKFLCLFDRAAKAERPNLRTLALQKDIFGLTPLHYTVMGALRDPEAATTLLKNMPKGDVPSDLIASALWWGNVDIAKACSSMSVHPRLDSEDGKRLISDVIQMKQQPPAADQALPAALTCARDRMNAKLSEPPVPSPARAHPRLRDIHTHARSPGREEGGTATKKMGGGGSHERTQKSRRSRSRSSERKLERERRRGKTRSRSRSCSGGHGGNGGGRNRDRGRSRSRSRGRSRSRSHSRSKGKRRLSVSHDSHTHTDARGDGGDGRRKRGGDRSRERDRHDEDERGGNRRRRASMSASKSPPRRAGTDSAATTAADIHPMYRDLLAPAADATGPSLQTTLAHQQQQRQQQPSTPDPITETLRIQLEEVKAKREEAKAERIRLQQEVNARQQSLADRLKKMKDETAALAFKTQSIRDVTKDWETATMAASEALERVQQACTEHEHELRRFNELIDAQSGTAHVQTLLQDRKTEAASLQAQLEKMNDELASLQFSSERLEELRSDPSRCDFRTLEAANVEMINKRSLLEADIAQLHRSIAAAETELAHVTQRAEDAEAIARHALKRIEVEEWRLKVEVCNLKRTLSTVVTALRIAEENENDARKEYVRECAVVDAEMAELERVLERAEKEVPEVVQLNLRDLQEEIVAVEKQINELRRGQNMQRVSPSSVLVSVKKTHGGSKRRRSAS